MKYNSVPFEDLTKEDLKKLQKLRETCLKDNLMLLNEKYQNINTKRSTK